MVIRSFLLLGVLTAVLGARGTHGAEPELVSVQRIWDRAPHNAFTDLIRHDGEWLCVFREGSKHVSPDGSLRVIASKDGKAWKSRSLVTHPEDLRDAKLSHTPDGRLLLNGAGMVADADIRYHSMTWLSSDGGRTWDEGRRVGDPGYWLWRVQWQDGKAYTMGYRTDRDRTQRSVRLYVSDDGKEFDTLVPKVNLPAGCGEDRILFDEDGSALCLFRYEAGNKLGYLGKSQPPYKEWTWQQTNLRLGGPNLIRLPDGRIVAATRLFTGGVHTGLCWVNAETAQLTEFLRLPSGGDTSYPGLVWHEGELWVSYYSSHEKKTAIYLARVKL